MIDTIGTTLKKIFQISLVIICTLLNVEAYADSYPSIKQGQVTNPKDTIKDSDGFTYIRVEYPSGLFSAENIAGEQIIPPIANEIKYDSNRFLVKSVNGYELYDTKGHLINNLGNHPKMVFFTTRGSTSTGSDFTYITLQNSGLPLGIWDIETGVQILAPYRYEFVYPSINKDIKYCLVKEKDKYGLCNWDGDIVVDCDFEWFQNKANVIRMFKDKDAGIYIEIPYEQLKGTGRLVTSFYETHKGSSDSGSTTLYSIDSNNSETSLYSVNTSNLSVPSSPIDTYDFSLPDITEELVNMYNNMMEQFSGASVMAIPGKNNKFGLLIMTSGNVKPSQVTFTLIRNKKSMTKPLNSFPRYYWSIITNEEYLPGDKITLTYNGDKLAEECIPLEESDQYLSFCENRKQTAMAIVQRMMQYNMNNMSSSSFQNNSQHTNHNRQIDCSFCHGSGYSPVKKKPANYGQSYHSDTQCTICGDWDIHYHERCPSCGGNGKIEKSGF